MNQEDIIKGHCITNLDDYDASFVIGFAKVPNEGDWVYAKYKGNSTSLRVCKITHDWRNNQPYIIVELTRRA